MAEFDEKIDQIVSSLDVAVMRNIQRRLQKRMDQCGIMYRIFSRVKSIESIKQKLDQKREKYEKEGKMLQDAVGFRIVMYFKDDINICIRLLKEMFVVDNCEHDELDSETFKPQRINYVFRIPDDIISGLSETGKEVLIDNTFEVQIRTIFSEGWHEVEHDVRYKYKKDWEHENAISRELNGVFAVLEICDNNILSICENMAYKKYKEKEWEAMLRHKFRLRLRHTPLANDIREVLDENSDVAKALYRYDREKIIDFLYNNSIPLNCNNIVFIANQLSVHNQRLETMVPERIKRACREPQSDIKKEE